MSAEIHLYRDHYLVVRVDSTDVKTILFITGVKGAQVEEIYDLSKPFKGCVQCASFRT